MIHRSLEVEIDNYPQYSKNCLVFRFIGKLTQEGCRLACSVWEQEFSKVDEREKFVLIWDCKNMTGFEISAKNEWLETLNLLEERVEEVIVVSGSTLIRTASLLMLKLFKLKTQFVPTYDKIKTTKPKKKNDRGIAFHQLSL